jgi:glycerol-3-phosphate dehydrogenase (NAD(P)+)
VPIVSVAKGIEVGTLLRPTAIIRECLGEVPLACLSVPCIAPAVAARKPTGVVVASDDTSLSTLVQLGFATSYFRVYTSRDLIGVELAGAVKNVIAIAAGICDGIDAGDNAKAALVTRGLVEITRLGMAVGASADTFRGLAGVGDLVTTCISRIGRNRSAGERIGRGATTEEVVASTPSVIEGIETTRSVLQLAARHDVEMPIVSGVASVLFDGRGPADAIGELMTRQLRSE